MDIVFMGTPDFAVPSLKGLINEFGVKAVFTQPDKPKGRGKKLSISPIKEVAIENNIPVFQPDKLKSDVEMLKKLKDMKPDFIIVVAYGQILTREVLDIPKYGCINLHASILPKYRGAAPINWAILNGEKESGNTTMFMDIGLDTGDMLLKSHVDITEDMTAGQLHDILMEDGSELLIRTIKGLLDGTIAREKQSETPTEYAKMLNKDIAKINWNDSSINVKNHVRGLNPWPIAYTQYNGQSMKIYEAKVLHDNSSKEPGYILDVTKEGIKVACEKGCLLLQIIQFPGGKPMYVSEYIKGHDLEKGIILGK
ncbi:methionyl-tRNA formyltransferase [Clostridium magnum]|uniref:Methionyl-tRNA formyltransferase n=1 Tax=Clostridium magnum DSM 2767 TaxID=1121326 RepID=A0A162UZ41_9CLOT|nr:methionyl-tRNA formyltransferase [Clostridium magnum]KZL94429.1 methionyl-tRNA formyltransferase [Clostridium magnum DSM 2767]SHI22283.1 methionyl-tRNA formyltransferase [Clostridium magnum DSM 2767]